MTSQSGTITWRVSLAISIAAVLLLGSLIGNGAVSGDEPRENASEKARQLAVDVVSRDAKVRQKTAGDLINGQYRDISEAERLSAVLILLQTPDSDPSSNQGLLIEYLPQILGTKANEAAPTLLAYIADEKLSTYLRGRAIFAVARVAPQNTTVVAALMKIASSDDVKPNALQEQAIEALGKIGQPAEPALPMLHELLKAKNKSVQNFAFEGIGRIMLAKSPNAEFGGALNDKDPGVRAAAHEQLRVSAQIAQPPADGSATRHALVDERSLTTLREILESHADDVDRWATVKTLSITGPGGDPRMIKVLLGLANESPYNAVQALARLDPSDPAAVEVLLESLRRTSHQPRSIGAMAAVRGLQRYGIKARAAVPDVLAGFDRLVAIPNHEFSVDDVREYLATMIAADPTNVAVVSRILDLMAAEHPLNHPIKPYPPVAPLATEILAMVGLPTDPKLHEIAVARLATALTDRGRAGVAAHVLEKTDVDVLRPDAAVFVPLLVKILKAPRADDESNSASQVRDGEACLNALRGLARLGPAAKEALPLLENLAARERLPHAYDVRDSWENAITMESRKTIGAISHH